MAGGAAALAALLEKTVAGRAVTALAAPEAARFTGVLAIGQVHVVRTSHLEVNALDRIFTLEVTEGATIYRNGPANLQDFQQGDDIVAEGQWDNEVFRATSLMTSYRAVEGTVTGQRGRFLDTDQGTIEITPETASRHSYAFPAVDVTRLSVGDPVAVMVTGSRANGAMTAVAISGEARS